MSLKRGNFAEPFCHCLTLMPAIITEDMNADVLFEHIKAVGLTPRKFQHTMVELVDMNNVERRKKNAAIPATN